MAYSFIDLAKETLEIVNELLTQKEIWGNAIELNITNKVGSSGKTLWNTIDRLTDENIDFKQFICDLTEDIKVWKVKSIYDKVLGEKRIVYHYCSIETFLQL